MEFVICLFTAQAIRAIREAELWEAISKDKKINHNSYHALTFIAIIYFILAGMFLAVAGVNIWQIGLIPLLWLWFEMIYHGWRYSKFLDFSREHNEHAIPGLKGIWGWKLKVLYLLAFMGGIGWIIRYI